MSKPLLRQTKRQFVSYFSSLPKTLQMKFIMTSPKDKTELARLRRLHIKTINDMNIRELKEVAANRETPKHPEFLRPAIVEIAPPKPKALNPYKCRSCDKRFVTSKRRRTHENKYHRGIDLAKNSLNTTTNQSNPQSGGEGEHL